jgi:N-acetylmuramoyl-L-alanine amidase
MIKSSGADFSVSVHCNSFDSLTVNGARVYWHENNANAQQSEALAETLAQAINGISNTTNKEAYAAQGSYAVVRDVHIPSVLVETCFLTGEEDAKLASDPMWIYRMALALFNGIEAHFATN